MPCIEWRLCVFQPPAISSMIPWWPVSRNLFFSTQCNPFREHANFHDVDIFYLATEPTDFNNIAFFCKAQWLFLLSKTSTSMIRHALQLPFEGPSEMNSYTFFSGDKLWIVETNSISVYTRTHNSMICPIFFRRAFHDRGLCGQVAAKVRSSLFRGSWEVCPWDLTGLSCREALQAICLHSTASDPGSATMTRVVLGDFLALSMHNVWARFRTKHLTNRENPSLCSVWNDGRVCGFIDHIYIPGSQPTRR